MSEKNAAKDKIWPMPVFHFKVTLGTEVWSFQEVSGLTTEVEVLEYRHGKSKQFGSFKMPGRPSTSDAILKKGVFKGDTFLFDWFKKNLSKVERKEVTIALLSEKQSPEIIWTLSGAFPKKIESANLNATDSGVAVESVTLAYEELEIKKA